MEHKTVRRATATFGVIWWIKILFESFSAPQSTSSKGFSTIWLVWGAEHADEGSRRVKTLLPSSVTDNGFAALDIKDYTTIEFTMEQEIVEWAVNIINQIVINTHAEAEIKSKADI